MPSSTINWSSTETWQRLVAAIFATDIKVNLHDVAKMYGTTYDTIQNRHRKIRKEADALKEEVESGARGEVATPKKGPKTPSAAAMPKSKSKTITVTNGRVTKSSPTKKTKVVKQEKKGADAEDDIFAGVDFGADLGDVGMVDEDEFVV